LRAIPLLLLLLGACVEISPEHTCRTSADCVLDGVEGRCEPSRSCSFPDAGCGPGGHRYHDRAGARSGVCVVSLGGALALPPIDLKQAGDATRSTCAPAGARDVYVELSSPGAQILFVDTPTDSNGARTRLALRGGSCPGASGPELGCTPADECGPIPYNRLLVGIGPGTSCLVIEEADPAANTGIVQLRLLPAGRAGRALLEPSLSLPPGLADTITCDQPPGPGATCGASPGAPTAAFALPICPGAAQLSVAADPADAPAGMLDAVLSIRRSTPGGPEVACRNGSADQSQEMVSMSIGGPELYWILIAGAGASPCGPFAFSHSRL
jgi:hypothetical protein